MPHPLDTAGAVELAVVDRDGLPESRHLGAAALVDADGRLIESHGDMAAAVYPRSALKPFQAEVSLAAGAPLEPVQRVLACASHAGTDEHVAVVSHVLRDAGLDEGALGCPVAAPLDPTTAARVETSRLRMNCSGKHAAFLSACVTAGWDTATYLEPSHPLQRAVLASVQDRCGEHVAHTGTDGCGAPAHALTLPALARGASRLLGPGSALADDVRAHPWALDGPGRANTRTVEATGAVAKVGAEGYLLVVAPGGAAVSLKVLDGSQRVTTFVALSLLARAGALDPDVVAPLLAELTPPPTGGGHVVGSWRLSV
ncbi:asparaginase [Isoptericola sp. b441]|uniref:Asparaginase n=1 Tax=Actinotalea lenta TaxID=3064654 RepID=A0ABT9D4V6_9CELL|nr:MULTISPECIES: asparaginase [unclassified Isoptericola]MDO8105742.1 asparaginase [Isoptericola sp. b441]MDO8122447.1 asparaginase [Isoptericola sp. b490]